MNSVKLRRSTMKRSQPTIRSNKTWRMIARLSTAYQINKPENQAHADPHWILITTRLYRLSRLPGRHRGTIGNGITDLDSVTIAWLGIPNLNRI
jgi:hypothetical protein